MELEEGDAWGKHKILAELGQEVRFFLEVISPTSDDQSSLTREISTINCATLDLGFSAEQGIRDTFVVQNVEYYFLRYVSLSHLMSIQACYSLDFPKVLFCVYISCYSFS